MALMKKLLDHCDIDSMLSTLGLPEPGSNRGYKPEEIIKSYLVSVWCGANRFMHTEVTHRDAVIEISETQYQGIHGSKARRMVIVRQKIQDRPKATGRPLRLFEDSDIYNQYRYHCFITNLTLPAIQVWNLYKDRAEAENRIKELKYDFGLNSFNLHSFYETEAALNLVMLAYNLMSLFRQSVIGTKVQQKM